jgi:hypothetical protein
MSKEFTPIFIGGTGRSGTTIILNLLKDHENFHSSLPREIRYLTDRKGLIDLNFSRNMLEQYSLKELRDEVLSKILPLVGKSNLDMFVSRSKGRWWSQTGKKGKTRGLVQGIPLEKFNDTLNTFLSEYKISNLESSRRYFYAISSAQFKKDGVQFFGDSTPPNIMNSQFLHKMFPEAKFINMVRDGRDVSHSVIREHWGPKDPFKALDWWKNRVIKANNALAQVPIEKQLTLRLENLIHLKREESLDLLLSFIGLNSSADLRSRFDEEFTVEKMHYGLWQSQISDPARFNAKYDQILSELESKGIVVEKFY